MKKLSCLFIIISLMFATTCYAYDAEGIWQLGGQEYYISVHVNGSAMIAVTYSTGDNESYLIGNISGDTGDITFSSGLSEFTATVTFTSDTSATMRVNSCVPYSNSYCIFPAGVSIDAVKVF